MARFSSITPSSKVCFAVSLAVSLLLLTGCSSSKSAEESSDSTTEQAQSSKNASAGDRNRASERSPDSQGSEQSGRRAGREKTSQPPPEGNTQPPGAQPGGDQRGDDETISDEKLRQFVVASKEVTRLQREAQTKLQEAESREEAQAIKEDIQGKLQESIRSAGLTLQEFERISKAVQRDEQVRQRFRKQVDGMRK